jgi:hypothetical protein
MLKEAAVACFNTQSQYLPKRLREPQKPQNNHCLG